MPKLTREGYEKLQQELRELKEVTRQEVAKALKEAIAEGDLSENAAYEEAKDRQAQVEGRIKEIEQTLATAEVVEGSKGNTVDVGTTIRVKMPSGDEREFTITGSEESDPAGGKLSFDSPLGKAFLGHKKGDDVEVATPGGKKKYKILSLS